MVLKMVCVLAVQLPIHVMNRAPEETSNRKCRGDNKKRTEDAMINESDNVDEWTDDGGEWM